MSQHVLVAGVSCGGYDQVGGGQQLIVQALSRLGVDADRMH